MLSLIMIWETGEDHILPPIFRLSPSGNPPLQEYNSQLQRARFELASSVESRVADPTFLSCVISFITILCLCCLFNLPRDLGYTHGLLRFHSGIDTTFRILFLVTLSLLSQKHTFKAYFQIRPLFSAFPLDWITRLWVPSVVGFEHLWLFDPFGYSSWWL